MKNQDNLRQQVKIAKALNDDWNYKAMSQVIHINNHAFYNWLNGAYQLSTNKANQLQSLIEDLLA